MSGQKGRKILYIIFSIAISIALWTYVVYVGNPMLDEPMEVDNVPIEFTGEELLRDYDLIVSNIDARELTVYFGGRIRDISKVGDMEVRAVVDLTDILKYSEPTGTHALEYDLIYQNTGTLTVDRASIQTVGVTVERLATKTLQVKPMFEGSIAEHYMAATPILSRDSVTVEGTEAAIAKLDSARATLNWDNLSKSVTEEVPIELLDTDGAVIDPTQAGITFVTSDTVHFTQNVLMVKDVALVIDIVETQTVTDKNISIDISPATIRLSGDPEVLEGLNVINLGTVDLRSFTTAYSEDFQIRIPNDTNNLSGLTTARVNITIQDPTIEIRLMDTVNIGYRNAGDSDTVEILNESMSVIIRGCSDIIGQVMPENIRVVADLADYQGRKGNFEVPARVYVDSFPTVDPVGEYKVNVFIS